MDVETLRELVRTGRVLYTTLTDYVREGIITAREARSVLNLLPPIVLKTRSEEELEAKLKAECHAHRVTAASLVISKQAAESAESQRDKVRLSLSTARRLATESAAAVLDEFSTPYLSGGSLMLTNGKGPAYTPSGLAVMIRNNGEQKEDQPPKEEFLTAERVFTWMGHSANTLMCRQERHRLYPERKEDAGK